MAADETYETDLICVDANYNEVDCSAPNVAYRVSKEDAKAGKKAIEDAAVVPSTAADKDKPETTQDAGEPVPEEKAVDSAPANKAAAAPEDTKRKVNPSTYQRGK